MRKGFTLVELSIVLVIIGLLIGGILVAQSMIQTAKIQRLVNDLQQYDVGTSNFKLNYRYSPGDSPLFTPPGDGDNQLGYGPAGDLVTCNGAYYNVEIFQFFAHLSQPKMLDKNYIAYSPTTCPGGTLNPSNALGVIWPYTEYDDEAAAILSPGRTKHAITPRQLVSGGTALDLYLLPEVIIPLETKMGTTTNERVPSVLLNLYGKGNCRTASSTVPCTDPSAVYGLFYFILR